MSRVLVTGGSGFIGGHTVDELINQGYEVVVMDNYEKQVHRGTIPDYENKKAKYVRGDVRYSKHWSKALTGCEYIIHLAAAVGVGQSFWQSTKYFSVNTIGTSNLYDILIHEKVSLFKIKKMSWPPGKAFTVKALTHATLISVTIISKNLARVFKTLLNGVPV